MAIKNTGDKRNPLRSGNWVKPIPRLWPKRINKSFREQKGITPKGVEIEEIQSPEGRPFPKKGKHAGRGGRPRTGGKPLVSCGANGPTSEKREKTTDL